MASANNQKGECMEINTGASWFCQMPQVCSAGHFLLIELDFLGCENLFRPRTALSLVLVDNFIYCKNIINDTFLSVRSMIAEFGLVCFYNTNIFKFLSN